MKRLTIIEWTFSAILGTVLVASFLTPEKQPFFLIAVAILYAGRATSFLLGKRLDRIADGLDRHNDTIDAIRGEYFARYHDPPRE